MDAATLTAACPGRRWVPCCGATCAATAPAGPAFWVPFLWLFLASSRGLSDWLGVQAGRGSAQAFADGSPLDRALLFVLHGGGPARAACAAPALGRPRGGEQAARALRAVLRRRARCGLDEPLLAQRRLLKDAGHGVMALALLSDPRPLQAIATLLRAPGAHAAAAVRALHRRLPELGTARSPGGVLMYTGVTHQKNELGRLCLVLGIGALWALLQAGGAAPGRDQPPAADPLRPPRSRRHGRHAARAVGQPHRHGLPRRSWPRCC
jgi:hypothetical protein